VHARGGLPNFLKKANTPGAEIKIAYFGGRITRAGRLAAKTLAYFQKTYPGRSLAKSMRPSAARDRTWGFFRLKQDVPIRKPDR